MMTLSRAVGLMAFRGEWDTETMRDAILVSCDARITMVRCSSGKVFRALRMDRQRSQMMS